MNENSQEKGKIAAAPIVDIMSPEEVDLPQSMSGYHSRERGLKVPVILFIATCLSTFFVGTLAGMPGGLWESIQQGGLMNAIEHGFLYAVPLMTILVCHEMGHFLQSYRYGVFATFPYFIPIPLPPIGTMGAVIAMEPRMGHRRALFDIGISGPLAGLIPTIIFCIVGIKLSTIMQRTTLFETGHSINTPLLFQWLYELFGKELPAGFEPNYHPFAFAGWVGLLITSLNLIPIGQLDGGHVLYAMMKNKTRFVSGMLLFLAIVFVGYYNLWGWSLMLILLLVMGPQHPPTADDDEPLGFFRYFLGWMTLAFILIGFTPVPFVMN